MPKIMLRNAVDAWGTGTRFLHWSIAALAFARIAPGEGRADPHVPHDTLVVDGPARRADAGLTTRPSAADVEGTRANMMTRVLDVERYPYAAIAVRGGTGDGGARQVTVAITLHGVTRAMEVPLRIEPAGGDLDVRGRLTLAQSDFGIVPFSILGGAIAVQDAVEVDFRIRAGRIE